MKKSLSFCQPRRNRGVALVLVLCFVVLITGLVVAYFSRTLNTRQLSNASTSTAQAELLASSATDVILGDLKQEIADGSLAVTPPPAASPGLSTGDTVYAPAKSAYAVPQRNPSPAPTGSGVESLPNLVRRSLRGDASGGVNAAPAPAPVYGSRASEASSATPSPNGRAVTPARWNRHYLLPTATPSPDATPGASPAVDPSTPVLDFVRGVPDWVFVTAERGPDVLKRTNPFKDVNDHTVTPTGRYAYAIYDEGGLLDINHTGYPSASSLTHSGAKPAPNYADLTQLPPPATAIPALSPANIDSLLGWRSYATLQANGNFPVFGLSGSFAETTYYNLFASTRSIPATSSPNMTQVPLAVRDNKTDQLFLSRQQLISYFNAASLDLRYLQYFGTFNRSLNQPSYLPEHSATSLAPADPQNPEDPFRRPVRAVPNSSPLVGENDGYANYGINPSFLTARVITPFKRYDQTMAVVGEPLVKKRFPLNRLAWLTYKGPSALRNTAATDLTGPDADIGYLKLCGITKEWLDQGTAGVDGNVMKYFGLAWDPANKWTYSHGTNISNGAILNVSNPAKSIDVVHLTGADAREPDFFELLKAAINPGSIAKTSIAPSILTRDSTSNHAGQRQYSLDTSLDRAILQIGANIIDQFDTDGYPTQINYNLGSTLAGTAVYGDENLPNISRVRSSLIHLVESDPVETTINAYPNPVKDTGVGALLNMPEIWNLHDWSWDPNDATVLKRSVGAVAPMNFKIYAKTNDDGGLKQATTVYVWNTDYRNSMDANVDASPGFSSKYHFNWGLKHQTNPKGGEPRFLSELNTKMTFSVDPTMSTTEALFREPTLLFTPGIPTGSSLACPTLVSTNTGPDGLGYLAMNPNFFSAGSGGLKSAVNGSNTLMKLPSVSVPMAGFYIGAHPLRWWDDTQSTPVNDSVYQTQFGPVNDITYILACEDGSGGWTPYDTKSLTTVGQPNANLQYGGADTGTGFNGTLDLDYGLRYYQTIDPRTSRFGLVDPWVKVNADSIPPRKGYSTVDIPQGVFKSDRDGVNSGTALYLALLSGADWFPPLMGWYPGSSSFGNDSFRPGLLEQNNPNVSADGTVSTGLLPPNTNISGSFGPFYYADADSVVRRAMGGGVDGGASSPAATTKGLPMANAVGTKPASASGTTGSKQMDSRPSILNRPFRSVAELGYVYSGTPWKNLDFFQPESGNSALLDVFCINDLSDVNAVTAGQVNLNTHQVPVLQAILAQTSKDQWSDATASAATKILGTGSPSGTQAQQLAQLLVTRTVVGPTTGPNSGKGPQPLQNVSDLVGRWVAPAALGTGAYDGKASCDGFTTDLTTFLDNAATADQPMHNVQRFGESALRTLSNAGQTRVWNLMLDIVAQTGRYGTQAVNLDQFNVEGEQHYWVHVAIDRYTGKILDKQVEVIKE